MAPRRLTGGLLLLALALGGGSLRADQPGQEDFDEAIAKRLDAESVEDLGQVAILLESSLAKGLDAESEALAKRMLGAISLQRGQAIVQQMMRGGLRGGEQLRTEALRSLEKAIESDPTLVEAHLLIARLSTLPGGNPKRALDAATAAIENLKEDPEKQSEAYVLRALLQEADEEKLSDLDAAIEADADNIEAYQARALVRMQVGESEGAIEDLQTLLERDPTNQAIAQAAVQALLSMERFDEAMDLLNEALAAKPTASLYRLRAAILQTEDRHEEALADLDKALAMEPRDFGALLQRAEIEMEQDDLDAAKRSVERAMQIEPQSVQGIVMRSLIAAQEGRIVDAVNDMKLLARSQPDNPMWTLQLATYYQMDQRPRMAIEVVSELLERDPENFQALRLRGDARLSINEHAKAVEDYTRALEIGTESRSGRSGLLNNLSWVLSTSPEDDVRDGPRALELAQEAAELSEYKEPHILSTLGAAHAELGDFEEAIKWAEKAVEVGKEQEHDQVEQLEEELESYREGKPWREAQETEENKVPLLAPEDLIDT